MELQLEKSSIIGLLQKNYFSSENVQLAEGRVRSTWLCEEMLLIGFIPYCFIDFRISINRPFVFTPYFLLFEGSKKPTPICKSVANAYGKEFLLSNSLEILSLYDQIPDYFLKNHPELKVSINGATLLDVLKRNNSIFRDLKENFIKKEDGYYYKGKEFEWELTLGELKYICRNFLCLCSYMNKVTGKPEYVLQPSERVIRILPKENDE